MPHFTVIPKIPQLTAPMVNVTDPARVLEAVAKLECQEADVLRDGEYAFSVHRGGKGLWVIASVR